MNLAVMVELPLVVIDVQRAGPSTGMPTKNEQSDLLQVMFGRNADSPIADRRARHAGRVLRHGLRGRGASRSATMTPVVYLSDAFLATGSEPWLIPRPRPAPGHRASTNPDRAGRPFQPYARDPDTLARPWAVPGTPGLEHRIGGLEKADITGNVSYDPDNHHQMQFLRQAEGRPDRRRHPAARGVRSRPRRPADPRLGLDLRGDPERRRAAPGAGSERGARPPPLPQPVPAQHRGRRPELPPRPDPRSQPGPAAAAHPGPLPDRRRGLRQGPRQALPDRRDRAARPSACSTRWRPTDDRPCRRAAADR